MSEPKQTPFYADKTFLAVVIGPILGIIARKLGVPLNSEEIVAFAATVIAFIAGHKWKGAKMAQAEAARLEAEAKVTTAVGTERRMEVAEKALAAALSADPKGIKVDFEQ